MLREDDLTNTCGGGGVCDLPYSKRLLGRCHSMEALLPRSPETKGILYLSLLNLFLFYLKVFILKFFILFLFLFLYFWRCGVLFGDGIFRTRSKRSCALGNKTGWGKVTHDASDQRPPVFLAGLSIAGLRGGGDGKRKDR
jgi:hypothetical protein